MASKHPGPTGAEGLAQHLKECAKVDAAIVMHDPSESADSVIEQLLAEGWTWDEQRSAEVVAGKRIRYLRMPEDRPGGGAHNDTLRADLTTHNADPSPQPGGR